MKFEEIAAEWNTHQKNLANHQAEVNRRQQLGIPERTDRPTPIWAREGGFHGTDW
jgi:hypothetical protein